MAYALDVPENKSVIVVPLRSNAYALLTGASVAAVRRRLKFASLFFDRVLLETGIFRVYAGPNGASSFIVPPTEQDPPRWQTPAERHAATGVPFVVALSDGRTQDAVPQAAVTSVTSISWAATLHPFADELPPGTDWVDFMRSRNPAGEVKQLAQRWTQDDKSNRSLERAIPVQFVRDTVINSANRDLVLAAAAGCAAALDPLHLQVVAQRFKDDTGWRLRGYSVPVIFPQVGELPWEAIADLRRDRNMARFRSVLREVEQETAAEAAGGDVEKAARDAYMRHLADASGRLEGVGVAVRKTVTGIVISGATGAAALPIPGPLGIVISTAAGAVPTTIINVRGMLRRRRAAGWLAVHLPDHRSDRLNAGGHGQLT
jgi:hypothetical protein